jgi:hypothetical protein
MKKRLQTLALALIVCALLSPAALANVKTTRVTFGTDVKVGETLVKKGDYKVRFDDQTSELTILDGKKVVVKTTARAEEQPGLSINKEIKYRTTNDGAGTVMLLSVNMGEKFAVIGVDNTAGTPAATDRKP